MSKLTYPEFYEQVGTPLPGMAEAIEAEVDPADLTIPTRAELEAKQAEKGGKNDSKAAGAEGGEKDKQRGADGDDISGGGDSKSGKSGDDAGDKDKDKGEEDEDPEAVLAGAADTEPVYQTTLEDPGEFKPADYSFEAVVYDAEGKSPKVVKITSVEQFEQMLDEDKNFGSAAALLKAQRMAVKMEASQERDEAEHKKAKQAYDERQTAVKAQNETLTKMANELNYLVSKGKLPAVAKKYQNADWTDPKIAGQPGVKEQVELLNYMKSENQTRTKLGLDPLSITGAYAEMKLEQKEKDADDAGKKALEARREAGARVAATTPAPVSAAPKGVSVGRVIPGGLGGMM